MTIEEKIKVIDIQLLQIKIIINLNYSTPLTTLNIDKISFLKDQRCLLLKQKERQDKLNKINET